MIASIFSAASPDPARDIDVVADPQVRYVGTLGGNVANGDPGNDMPAVMLALGATCQLAGKKGDRRDRRPRVLPGRLFHGAGAGEILTAVRVPAPPAGHGYAYEKLKRKVGDYATAAAAVVLTLGQAARWRPAPIGLTNVAETPPFAEQAGTTSGWLEPRCRHGEAGGRRGRGDHRAGLGQSRAGRLPHQDGRRDARAGRSLAPAPAQLANREDRTWRRPR